MHLSRTPLVLLVAAAAAGCGGPLSTMDPAGRDAHWIASVFFWMTAAFAAIYLAVMALALYAPRARTSDSRRAADLLIMGGGVAFPVAVLTALLIFGLAGLPAMMAPAPPGAMWIEVTGSQWWWRVRYIRAGGQPVETANELRLPVGERVHVRLASRDVVHSFWVPSIAGKIDMIPGRVNRLALEPTRTGTFRGACAEFCGAAHARMNFVVVVTGRQEFERWLEAQAAPARPPADPAAQRGERAFFERGCVACHTVRGTLARGHFGPDLTHVASRQSIAAGLLPARPEQFRLWIAQTSRLKPGVHMPAFASLPDADLSALAAYVSQLR